MKMNNEFENDSWGKIKSTEGEKVEGEFNNSIQKYCMVKHKRTNYFAT